jgi:LacI family transcriptional regulator
LQNSEAVKAETRAQVRRAMADLGYVYNRAAANLRSSQRGLIGLVINDLRNPFSPNLPPRWHFRPRATAVIANTDEDSWPQVVGAMLEHGVSALVLSSAYGDVSATFDAIARAGVPTLQVLRRAAPEGAAVPFAVPDYTAGSRMATEHLLSLGARRVAFVGGLEGREVTLSRMSGYLSVLAAGIEPPSAGRPARAFEEVAIRLAREHPEVDAALCWRPCRQFFLTAELGRKVGRDLRIIGTTTRGLQPGLARLTSVRTSPPSGVDGGHRPALAGRWDATAGRIVTPVTLIPGRQPWGSMTEPAEFPCQLSTGRSGGRSDAIPGLFLWKTGRPGRGRRRKAHGRSGRGCLGPARGVITCYGMAVPAVGSRSSRRRTRLTQPAEATWRCWRC